MIWLLVGFLILSSVLSMVVNVVLIKQLLKFDSLWDELDESLWTYQSFLEDKTGQVIKMDHPEVREFHEKNVKLRDRMRDLGQAVGRARDKGSKWASISDATSTRR